MPWTWSWPWRRSGSDEAASEVTTAPVGVRSGRRNWLHAPVLAPTVAIVPPVVGAPVLCPPDVAAARPLTAMPVLRDRSAQAPRGRVSGLAHPAGPSESPADLPPTDLPVVAHRRVRNVAQSGLPPLVYASPVYVGAAREAEEPIRPPEWLRAMPGFPEPPRSHPAPQAPAAPIRQGSAARMSRKNVGQSRRLGLGAPLPHPLSPERMPAADRQEPESEDGDAHSAWPISPDPPPAGGAILPHPLSDRLPVRLPELRPDIEPVPHDLAREIAELHHTDVSDVPVHRGRAAADEAASLHTRAFSRQQQVFLPAELGPLHDPGVRELLGHELTHVAQHRRLGGAIPAESSPEGFALEVEAVQTGRSVAGLAGPPPLRHAKTTLQQPASEYVDRVAEELVRRGIAHQDPDGGLVFGPASVPVGSGGGIQRELGDRQLQDMAKKLVESEMRYKADRDLIEEEQVRKWYLTLRDAGGLKVSATMSDGELNKVAKDLIEHGYRSQGTVGAPPSSDQITEMEKTIREYLSGTEETGLAKNIPKEFVSFADMRSRLSSQALGSILSPLGFNFAFGDQEKLDDAVSRKVKSASARSAYSWLTGQEGESGEAGATGTGTDAVEPAGRTRIGLRPDFGRSAPGTGESPAAGAAAPKPGAVSGKNKKKEEYEPLVTEYRSFGDMRGRMASDLARSVLSPFGSDLTAREDAALQEMAAEPKQAARWARDNLGAITGPAEFQPWQSPETPAVVQEPELAAAELQSKGIVDKNFDQLFTRIYDRVRSRLREELLVGRERAGRLADFR
jgi:hypothetical protein